MVAGRAQSAYSLLPLNNWPDEAERPLVLQLADGRYACLAEAALVNYSRSKFSLDPQKAVIKEIPDISFYDALPTVWDDTKIIEGKIGAYGTIARRHGDDWYVGSLTSEARNLILPLEFLNKKRQYEATIYADDASLTTSTKVAIKKMSVNASAVLKMQLTRMNGLAIIIRPLKK